MELQLAHKMNTQKLKLSNLLNIAVNAIKVFPTTYNMLGTDAYSLAEQQFEFWSKIVTMFNF